MGVTGIEPNSGHDVQPRSPMSHLINYMHMVGPFGASAGVMVLVLPLLYLGLAHWERRTGKPRRPFALVWLSMALALALFTASYGLTLSLQPVNSHDSVDSMRSAALYVNVFASAITCWSVAVAATWLAGLRLISEAPERWKSGLTAGLVVASLACILALPNVERASQGFAVMGAVLAPAGCAAALLSRCHSAQRRRFLAACLALGSWAGGLSVLYAADSMTYLALHLGPLHRLEHALLERSLARSLVWSLVVLGNLAAAWTLLRRSPATLCGHFGRRVGIVVAVNAMIAALVGANAWTQWNAQARFTTVAHERHLRSRDVPVRDDGFFSTGWRGRFPTLTVLENRTWTLLGHWEDPRPLTMNDVSEYPSLLTVLDRDLPISALSTLPLPPSVERPVALSVLMCAPGWFDRGPLIALGLCHTVCIGLAKREDAPEIEQTCDMAHTASQGQRTNEGAPLPRLVPSDEPMDVQTLLDLCTGPDAERPCVLVPPEGERH